MLPLLVEYLLRNRVTFIAFNTHLQLYRMSFFDPFPLLELMAESVEDLSVRAVGFSGSLLSIRSDSDVGVADVSPHFGKYFSFTMLCFITL
jgi:hypothetical protein